MSTTIENNKRIARNTLFLYIRMIIILLVQFYTSSVVLNVLGVNDFGLWSVMGSFIISFSFISGPLTTATQRFLNFEIGKGGNELNKIFCISLQTYIFIALILLLFFETVGVWFLNTQMNITPEKLSVANWTFQFAILAFVANFIRMPYESAIIAYEQMSFYAILCILEAVLLLGIVYILLLPIYIDKLILYVFFTFISKTVITLCYKFYSNKKFTFTRFHFVNDKAIFLQITKFSGWNLFGSLASISSTQGLNVLLNLFFGVMVNASYGVASQLGGGVKSFVNNFQKALNPQIVKSYASGDIDYLQDLLSMTGKYSFFLLFALACPVVFNIEFILYLWLGNDVPTYTPIFCNLMLIQMLVVCFGDPMDTVVFATGNIRNYQFVLSGLIFLNIVFSYVFFKYGFSPVYALIIKCVIEILILTIRLLFVKRSIQIRLKEYCKKTFLPTFKVAILTLAVMIGVDYFVLWKGEWIKLIFSCAIFLFVYVINIWFIGISRSEKMIVSRWLLKKVYKFHENKTLF